MVGPLSIDLLYLAVLFSYVCKSLSYFFSFDYFIVHIQSSVQSYVINFYIAKHNMFMTRPTYNFTTWVVKGSH